jgi:hypothetical protein
MDARPSYLGKALLGLCALMTGAVTDAVGADGPMVHPQLEAISAAYAKKQEIISSLLAKYTETSTPLASMEVLYARLHRHYLGEKRITVALMGRSLYLDEEVTMKDLGRAFDELRKAQPALFATATGDFQKLVSYTTILPFLEAVPVEVMHTTQVYDGEHNILTEQSPFALRDNNKQRPVVIKKQCTPKDRPYLRRSYFDWVGMGVADPGFAPTSEKSGRHRVVELLARGSLVLSKQSVSDQPNCVALEAQGIQRLVLDPALAFAIRSRHITSGEIVDVDVACDDFLQVAQSIWLPRRINLVFTGSSTSAEELRGKPLYSSVVQVSILEINKEEHAKLLAFAPEAGSEVMDTTIKPVDRYGNIVPFAPTKPGVTPTVSYLQPANEKDLDRAIEEGRRKAGGQDDQGTLSSARQSGRLFVLIINGVLVLILAAWLSYRRLRHPPG